tara:strand:+ start:128 stop:286 length:159 start_codon:yes stop_codon:yes gene_type:complete
MRSDEKFCSFIEHYFLIPEFALLLSVNFSEIPNLKSQVLMTLRQAATKKRMV